VEGGVVTHDFRHDWQVPVLAVLCVLPREGSPSTYNLPDGKKEKILLQNEEQMLR
jgi:hypothetical protein